MERTFRSHTIRPLPDEAISGFASWVQHELWTFVYDGLDVSDMVDRLNFLLQHNLDTHCPTKTVRTSNLDGKDTSVAVKQASRRKIESMSNMEIAKNTKSRRKKYKLNLS